MKAIVIDASMAANWGLDDEKNETANRILQEVRQLTPITTSIFWHEIRSIFLSSEKRGRITRPETASLLQDLRTLGIEVREAADDELILDLARQHTLSAYDAAYLALAMASNAILASNDRKLAQAALQADVELRTVLTAV